MIAHQRDRRIGSRSDGGKLHDMPDIALLDMLQYMELLGNCVRAIAPGQKHGVDTIQSLCQRRTILEAADNDLDAIEPIGSGRLPHQGTYRDAGICKQASGFASYLSSCTRYQNGHLYAQRPKSAACAARPLD